MVEWRAEVRAAGMLTYPVASREVMRVRNRWRARPDNNWHTHVQESSTT